MITENRKGATDTIRKRTDGRVSLGKEERDFSGNKKCSCMIIQIFPGTKKRK